MLVRSRWDETLKTGTRCKVRECPGRMVKEGARKIKVEEAKEGTQWS